jgi:hypothetical protein
MQNHIRRVGFASEAYPPDVVMSINLLTIHAIMSKLLRMGAPMYASLAKRTLAHPCCQHVSDFVCKNRQKSTVLAYGLGPIPGMMALLRKPWD